jgi:hypothetical protein
MEATKVSNWWWDKENVVYISTEKTYYSAIKKNKILSFAMTWMELAIVRLTETSQTSKERPCTISLICGI